MWLRSQFVTGADCPPSLVLTVYGGSDVETLNVTARTLPGGSTPRKFIYANAQYVSQYANNLLPVTNFNTPTTLLINSEQLHSPTQETVPFYSYRGHVELLVYHFC